MNATILPGRAAPLGATCSPGGTNFAVTSSGEQVRLCLFDADGSETQLVLPERDGIIWHGFVPGVGPGQAYGARMTAPVGCAATRPNCCWTRTPRRSTVKCG